MEIRFERLEREKKENKGRKIVAKCKTVRDWDKRGEIRDGEEKQMKVKKKCLVNCETVKDKTWKIETGRDEREITEKKKKSGE